MKNKDILSVLKLAAAPALLIVLGLILLLSPDTASALISRVMGWILGGAAICCGIAALASPRGRAGKVIAAVVFAVAGGWLAQHPLMLAATIGRFAGVLLLIDGIADFLTARKQGRTAVFSLAEAAAGVLLLMVPMAASRLVFSLCGLAVAIGGVLMLLRRLKEPPQIEGPKDPDIIDAL